MRLGNSCIRGFSFYLATNISNGHELIQKCLFQWWIIEKLGRNQVTTVAGLGKKSRQGRNTNNYNS
jgi:hypothetical protein